MRQCLFKKRRVDHDAEHGVKSVREAHARSGFTRHALPRLRTGLGSRAPRDPVWVSDGVASTTWSPVSPVTGEIVPCLWKAPFDQPDGRVLSFRAQGDLPKLEAAQQPPEKLAAPTRLPDDPGID